MRTDEELRDFVDGAASYKPKGNGAGSCAPIPYVLFADARPVLSNLWLIKGVLPTRGVAVIYGPSGEGKTFVALDLLLHVARGAAWRGRKTAQAGVLYLGPDGGRVVANRLEAYRRCHGVPCADLVVVSAPIDLLGKVSASAGTPLRIVLDRYGDFV